MPLPRHITDFEWDEQNITHVARHNLEPEEIEEAFCGVYKLLEAEDRFLLFGQTDAGRYVLVVFAIKDTAEGEVIRVITARDLTRSERRWYARQKK